MSPETRLLAERWVPLYFRIHHYTSRLGLHAFSKVSLFSFPKTYQPFSSTHWSLFWLFLLENGYIFTRFNVLSSGLQQLKKMLSARIPKAPFSPVCTDQGRGQDFFRGSQIFPNSVGRNYLPRRKSTSTDRSIYISFNDYCLGPWFVYYQLCKDVVSQSFAIEYSYYCASHTFFVDLFK